MLSRRFSNQYTHLFTFSTTRGEFLLITCGAVDIFILWYERLSADRVLAQSAHETLVMPLLSLVLHLLHTCKAIALGIALSYTSSKRTVPSTARAYARSLTKASSLFICHTLLMLISSVSTLSQYAR